MGLMHSVSAVTAGPTSLGGDLHSRGWGLGKGVGTGAGVWQPCTHLTGRKGRLHVDRLAPPAIRSPFEGQQTSRHTRGPSPGP